MKSWTLTRRAETGKRRGSSSSGGTEPGAPFLYVGGLLFLAAVLTYLDHFTVGRAGYPFWVLLSVLGTVSSATGTLSIVASEDPIPRPGGLETDMVAVPRSEWIELQQLVRGNRDRVTGVYATPGVPESVRFPPIRLRAGPGGPPHRTGIRRSFPPTEVLDRSGSPRLPVAPPETAASTPSVERRPVRLPVEEVVSEIERLARMVEASQEPLPELGLPGRRTRTVPAPAPDPGRPGLARGTRLTRTRVWNARDEAPAPPPTGRETAGAPGGPCTSCGARLGPLQPTYPCESCGEPRCLDCKERGVAQGHSLLCPRCAYLIEEAERELRGAPDPYQSGPPGYRSTDTRA